MEENTRGNKAPDTNQDTSKENPLGNKSYLGATSTDLDKIRLQTVAANDPDETTTQGVPNTNKSRSEMDNRTGLTDDDDIFDQGSVRFAAYSKRKDKGEKGGQPQKNQDKRSE